MNLPKHKMGVHWIPVHQRREDEQYMQELRPSCIKIINPDPSQVRRCLNYIDSNGWVWLRDHPLSEQKKDAMERPTETGLRHANEWADKLFNGRFRDVFDPNRIIVSGINEPFVRDQAEEQAAFEYNLALLNRATELGFKVAALNLSVGWPRNLGRDMPPYWEPFFPLENAINKGGHFLCVHEYWYDDPDESWFDGVTSPSIPHFGWLSHRVNYCPMQVPIIIGECGMEKMVDLERWENEGRPNKGWIGNLTPDQYAEQLWRYARKVNNNVVSILPFTTDWGSHDWDTQDTLHAQPAILGRREDAKWPKEFPQAPIHRSNYTGDGSDPVTPPVEPPKPDSMVTHSPYPPNAGAFVRGFGATLSHGGIDIAMATGTPLYAMADGEVAWVDTDTAANGGYGKYVRIYYPELGFDSFYAHCSEQLVSRGDKVKAGQMVAKSGNTGNSTGPHLHLEIRLKDERADWPIHQYAPNSAFGRGRTDPEGVLRMLQRFTQYSTSN